MPHHNRGGIKMHEIRRKQKYQFWKKHHELWQASGMTQSEYCRHHHLTFKTFNNWIHKTQAPQTGLIKFMPIEAPASTASLEIKVGDQISIKLESGFNKKLFQEIIKALGETKCS